jgi:prohibitin 1
MVRKCNELQQLHFFCSSGRRDLTTQRELTDRSFTTMAQALNTIYKYAIPLALGVSFAQASIYDVKGGTRAVIFDRLSGVKDQVVNEGTHFLIPWLQKSIIYDVRTKPRNISTTTGSKDLQMVSLTLRVLHRPEVKMLPKIYQV